MKYYRSIILNVLWNITGLGIMYILFCSTFDLIYIITCKGALDRFRGSAYFAPFDINCNWKKRFPYYPYPRRPKKIKKKNTSNNYINYSTISTPKPSPIITPKPSTMTGVEFESFICNLLKKIGYKNVQQTSYTNDFGADIIAQKPVGSSYENVCIQCKRYAKPVSNSAIQEIYAAKKHYKCETAIVITDSVFTSNAIKLAKDCGVILWDKYILNEISKNFNLSYDFIENTELEEDEDSLSFEEIDNFDILDE